MDELNVLFVHETSYEKKPIFEMHEFPEYLAARGHKITFLQFDEGFRFWRDEHIKAETTVAGRVLAETSIRLVTPHQVGIPGFDRLFVTVSVWPTLDRLLKNEKFDAIVLYAVPTYGPQVIMLAKRHGVPIIFRALDVSHLIRKSLLRPLIKLTEEYVYRRANFLSANNPAMARYCSTLGRRTNNTSTNMPPLDVLHFTSHARSESLAKSFGITHSDKVLVYMGTFFHFSGLDTVIREFASVAGANPNMKILLIGGGEQDAELKALVSENGLSGQIIFTGFVSYASLPDYIKVGHVAINPMHSRPVSNTAFPHKVLQYMAAGIPVVSTKLEGLFETLGAESGVTWVEGPGSVLRGAIELLADDERCKVAINKQNESVARLLNVDRSVTEFEALLLHARRAKK